MSDRWMLVEQRIADELGTPLVAGSHGMEVPMCHREAQPAVRAAPGPVGILVVLPIVLAETETARRLGRPSGTNLHRLPAG